MSDWLNFVNKWKNCKACPLGSQRDRIVLARGSVPAYVLFVGEAPGASEDAIGLPFVDTAPAGHIFNQIIERALSPEVTHAICNLVCCFPRLAKEEGINHEPQYEEILACRSRLIEFVNIVKPRLIVCVGKLSTAYVDHDDGVPCIDIVHPAAITRMPLAQKHMAVQRAIVQIRSAVAIMLECEYKPFTKWGNSYASTQPSSRGRTYSDRDIPF